MDLARIRADLADVLHEARPDWSVEPYTVDDPPAPCLMVGSPDGIAYQVTVGGPNAVHVVTLPVVVVVPAGDVVPAQQLLDEILTAGHGSVVSSLHGARRPSWKACRVTGAGNIARAVTDGGAQLLAADITVQITA